MRPRNRHLAPTKVDDGRIGSDGNGKRGTGLLNNELYVGRLVWNRLRYIRGPDTGKRVSRINPPGTWVITEVPELRIIDDELREVVKARQKEIDEPSRPSGGTQAQPAAYSPAPALDGHARNLRV